MPSPSTVLLRTQTDERLVALVRAGHDRAFEAIVERYRRPLLRACRRILPEARAEDALQQALMAAWNGLRRGDDVHELRPWLYRITRNTALNQLRASGYDLDELLDSLTAADDPEEEVLRRAVVRQTLAAVAALPERQREALLRTAVSGHGQEEVARDLGLSSTAMRQLVHRARVSVRSAATALVPLPFATWLAAGAGGAGATATIAKAGTVVVLAGGAAAAAPAIIEHRQAPPQQRAEHRAEPARAKPRATAEPTATVVALKPVATVRTARTSAPAQPQHEAEHSGSDDNQVERAAGGAEDRTSRDDDHTSRDDDHTSRGDRHEGDDTETSPQPVATPAPTPEAGEVNYGHGDDGALEERRDGADGGSDSASGSGIDEPDD